MSSSPPIAPVSSSPPLPSTSPPSNSSTLPPPPSTSQPTNPPPSPPPNSQPSSPSAPPPQSPPPPATPATPPPSPPQSPPPVSTRPPSPPASPPPSLPVIPPPAVTSPPPSIPSPPPPETTSSPPPPEITSSPPPQASPSIPAATPPTTSQNSPPSPPPPAKTPPPPSTKPQPPKVSPSPPVTTPSPSDVSPPTPTASSPPSTPPLPPKSAPAASSPPVAVPPDPPSSNGSRSGNPVLSPLPVLPTEKPTARPTEGNTGLGNATSSPFGGLNTRGAVLIGLGIGFFVLSLLVFAVWYVKRRKKREPEANIGWAMPSIFSSPQSSEAAFLKPYSPAPHIRSASGSSFAYSTSDSGVMSSQRSWFTYEELVHATNGFSDHNLLGEGGFGSVYKGLLMDGREVAVKQLKIGGGQGEREFRAEVDIISRVHHRHLVSLVGYCISEHQRLLVYDYVPNNTLHYHLHGGGRPVMAWETRVKVACGAARGIAYLHEDCHPRIIHRDIKSSNILLDNNFEARVSDFGLAKIALDSNTHVSTRVMGTFGYMAPEYATSGKLSEKSDVYSFGVVLLELITGRKPVDASQPLGDESLVEWARPLLAEAVENEDFRELADPQLGSNYVPSEMFRMIEAAAASVRHSASRRPKMSQVVRALDVLEEAGDISNGMKPGQSRIYDTAQQSAQIRMFQRMAFGSQDYSTEFFNQSHSSWRSRESGDYGTRDSNYNYIP